MSLSEAPVVKITYNTAQDISDEILGGTIQFCRETGFKQNIMMLTFFWSAFLLAGKSELDEHDLTGKVIECYTRSLSSVFPKLSEDVEMRQKVNEMQQHYWKNLSADFSVIKTEAELSSLLEIANKMNFQDNNGESEPLKTVPEKPFVQVSNAINSSIYRYLRQIDNGFGIEYKEVLNEFRYARIRQESGVKPQNTSPKATTTAPTKSLTTNETPLGMAWYKFLIYFALIAGAVINILYGFNYISGGIYFVETNGDVSAEQVYAYYGTGLQVVDVLYGLFLLAFAVLAFVLRHKLANYKPDAPKFVKIFYSISAGAPLLYSIIVALITGQSLAVNAIISLIVGLIFLFANVKYFNKRAHLFVDKTEVTIPMAQLASSPTINNANGFTAHKNFTPKTDPQKILFCRKCGARLAEDSTFCHKCGTKIL